MANLNSKIEWTDATWSPVTGCTEVSEGCDHCYAKTFAERWRGIPGHPYEQGFDLKLWPERLDMPLRWRKPRRIFVNSMSDLFHDAVPDEFIAQAFAVMATAESHTFQVLTKRPGRMASLLSRQDFEAKVRHLRQQYPQWRMGMFWPLPNVWLGVSVETQKWADIRIPKLLATPAAVRFLSVEPLLAPVDLRLWLSGNPHPDWIIVGGESGIGYRPIELDWVRLLRDQAEAAKVAFFFKQWGGRTPKAGGRLLDGRAWDEYPRVDGAQVVRAGHRVSPEASDHALQLRLGLP